MIKDNSARTSERTNNLLDEKTRDALVSRLRGPVLYPGHAEYDQARQIWNSMIDRYPTLIVRCNGVADIIETVNFARDRELLLAVRGGGHNVAGLAVCDGGIMLDLSSLKGIHVDPSARSVRAQPGVVWGELDRETQVFGLATPGGFISTTGIAGLTLGGGFGWLSRKHGFTCDNLLSVDIVTADGRFLTASEREHADLFWGIRGGGGNFGIATSFHYRLYPVGPTVVSGLALYPMERAAEILSFYRTFSAEAPEELGTMALLRHAPPAPFLPVEIHGKPVVGIAVCYAGPVAEGERAVRPLKELGACLADTIGPKPYTAHQSTFDSGMPPGRRYYWKSEYLPPLDEKITDTVIAHAAQITSPFSQVALFQMGGATSRAGEDHTAASHRNAAFVINISAAWQEPTQSEVHMAWARSLWSAMQPFSIGGVYVNFLSQDEGEDRVRAAYGANYARLVALKNKYDPSNLFRMNQNIKPTV
jgi:FAD/FMN-containing dehydrogenase